MNFILTMSGGTTPVINSTLVGVIKGIKKFYPNSKLFIPKPGIVGIMNKNIFELDLENIDNKTLKDMQHLPGSSLTGAARVEKFNKAQLTQLEETLKQLNITTFINIGGSGTIKQTKFLDENIKGINFIALPKTIDNDLGDSEFSELLFTPGYLSAAKYIINHTYNLIRENEGASFNDKVVVSQIFGRETGFLAALANLVENERVITLFPEKPISKEVLLQHVKDKIDSYGGCIIIVPEGYDINGSIFAEDFDKEYDESGQVKWSFSHNSVAQIIISYLNKCNITARICNTTIEQRQSGSFLDSQDIKIAHAVGFKAIKLSKKYQNFFMGVNKNIKLVPIKLSEISDFNRNFPTEWIDDSFIKTNKLFKEYFKSLKPGKRIISKVDSLSIIKYLKTVEL